MPPSDIFERFLKRYEMPKITFHQIRHTSVSLLINGGVQTQAVSKRAGHSSVSTTNNIYSHVFQSIETQAVEKMNEIFEIVWKKNPLASRVARGFFLNKNLQLFYKLVSKKHNNVL